MFIVEGTYNKKKLPSRACFILSKRFNNNEPVLFGGPDDATINLNNNIASVDILTDEKATGGGVQGAAGGAVLGFLIAGPLGTAVGAGIGSKKSGRDNTTLMITWANGDVWVVDSVNTKELAALKVAVATYKPKRSLSKPKKKASNKKTTYKNKISIKKPKFPHYWDLKVHKERSAKDTTTLPNITTISELQNLDGHNIAIKLFTKLFKEEIENYNNWKWKYFNLKIETEKEINTIAQHAIKKLIVTSNEASKVKDNSKDIEVEIEECKKSIEDYKSRLKTKEDEINGAGFFKKGSIKKEINNIEYWMKDSKADLSKAQRSLKSIIKKIKSIEEIKSIEKGSEEFVSIFRKIFPDEKKPSKTLKTKLFFNDEFFCSTYKKVFDEIWDKKIEDEINKIKEQEKKKKETKAAPKESKTSKKEQLLELQELLDEGLISDEEFKDSRKTILGLN